MKRHVPINNKYFEVIPSNDPKVMIIELLKRKSNLKQDRLLLVEKSREIHKEIYNLSMQMTELDNDIDRRLGELN